MAAAIHLLQTKRITLLNPATWDDKNDAYFMAEYKRILGVETVLALCFAETNETYHHWRVFSHGSDGVCIEFDKALLLKSFEKSSGIKQGAVDYKLVKSLAQRSAIDVEQLPFLKRKPYAPECEYRVIYIDKSKPLEFKDFPIDIAWIRRITLSPWMSQALAKSVQKTMLSIEGCLNLRISHSTLISNDEWKSVTARATSSKV
ncbi:hypothetical protein V3H18_15395 [Methylocystis sp. 9N]|uniref:DUF2971 domain-containing protein n=1 Tax=Methylocystis borbori TaxID=3118750 RepID=A0ABU7XKK3_9HYPH